MSQDRPTHAEIVTAVAKVDAAVTYARSRRDWWKRRHAPLRVGQLAAARLRCADAVVPLRSWLGMTAWGGIDTADELEMKRAVAAARYERRQIDKMLS